MTKRERSSGERTFSQHRLCWENPRLKSKGGEAKAEISIMFTNPSRLTSVHGKPQEGKVASDDPR